MIYSKLQMIKQLGKEEKNLRRILRKIAEYNHNHNIAYAAYSKTKVMQLLNEVTEERTNLITEASLWLENANIHRDLKNAIKQYYFDDKTMEMIYQKFGFDNFQRDIKNALYR